MVTDSIEYLKGRGLEVLFDAEHFFDGYKRNPEFSLRVLEGAAQVGADRLVLCDTNGGALPARGRAHRRRGRRLPRPGRRDRRPPPRRHRLWRRERARRRARRRDAGAGHDQRVRRAHRELQPHDDHPEPHDEDGGRDAAAGPARAAHAGRAPRRRAGQHGAEPAGRVRRAARRSRTRPVCTSARSSSGPTRTSTSSPDSVGNGTRFVMSEMAGKSTIVLKAKELGIELDGPTINEVVDTLKHLEHEGYHFEVADASLELLMRRASGWEQDFFRVESFRVITDDLAADDTPGGVTTEATIKLHVGEERSDRDRRGQRSGQRARPGAARRARRSLPGARPAAPDRLQGAGPRHPERHRRDHPGPARLHRRRGVVDHDRRQREHHRGQLAGPVRLARLWLAPSLDRGGSNQPCPLTRTFPSPSTRSRARRRTSRPGSHMPPSGSWRADRPGDLGAIQPKGALLGSPGPNVGLRAHAWRTGPGTASASSRTSRRTTRPRSSRRSR